jgi:hypothetical protein
VWRFQFAEEQIGASFLEERLSAKERATRIDAALRRLPARPENLARVLRARYGVTELLPDIRGVFREHAPIAAMTLEAAECFERATGRAPRPRSRDVRDWIGAMCARIGKREATGADTVALDEVRRAAEAVLREAEDAYEAAAEGARAA